MSVVSLTDTRERVRTTLQDIGYVRWTQHELNNYINDTASEIIRQIKIPQVSKTLAVTANTSTYSVPEGLMDIEGAEWDDGSSADTSLSGVAIATTSEMKRLSSEGRLPISVETFEPSMVRLYGSNYTSANVDWKKVTGNKPIFIVIDQRSTTSLTVYPIPTAAGTLTLTGTLEPTPMSDLLPTFYNDNTDQNNIVTRTIKTTPLAWGGSFSTPWVDDVGQSGKINSGSNVVTVTKVNATTTTNFDVTETDFTTTVDLPKIWEEAVVYGALERSYLKEHDLRNVEKSEYFRNKKLTLVNEAYNTEPIHAASKTGGVNWNRFVVRHW